MKQFAIIGHPILHTLSPLMHSTAFEALGMDCSYEPIDVEPDDLGTNISELRKRGVSGFNVTLPHKEAILPLLDSLDPAAKEIGAVNTVVAGDGTLVGYNTDAVGFVKCVEPIRPRILKGHVAVLGAGGAARAVLHGLIRNLKPSTVTIFNRTLERSERLAREFGSLEKETRVKAESLFDDGLQKNIQEIDVIINTTSVGMEPFSDASPLEEIEVGKKQAIVELIYAPLDTKLIKTARDAGATVISGLEMLLQQGAAAFALWTGREMPLDNVRAKLLQRLGKA